MNDVFTQKEISTLLKYWLFVPSKLLFADSDWISQVFPFKGNLSTPIKKYSGSG